MRSAAHELTLASTVKTWEGKRTYVSLQL